jgi:hypothetical protein
VNRTPTANYIGVMLVCREICRHIQPRDKT